MTTERIADIQARIRNMHYRQRTDSLDYHLIRARVRLLQDNSTQGLLEAERAFKEQLAIKMRMQTVSAHYGLALIALQRKEPVKARQFLSLARKEANDSQPYSKNATFASTSIDIHMAAGNVAEATKEANRARQSFSLSRGFVYQYSDALIASKRTNEATLYLRDQVQQYRSDAKLQRQLAKAYSAQGKRALMHLALAEAYELSGSLGSALEQLSLARRAPDALSLIHI